jgi:AsmA-like C-terminal region
MAHSLISPPTHHSTQPDESTPQQKGRIPRPVRSIWYEAPLWVHVVIVATGAVLAIAIVLISANWPYRHRKIAPMLEDILTSEVTFSKYHRVYFPRPGFEATGITIRRRTASPGQPPLGHIDSMMLVGTWTDLIMLRHRVKLIDITGFHAIVPAVGSRESKLSFPHGSAKEFTGPDTFIERMLIHNSLLEILRKNDPPLSFPIKQLEIRNFHRGGAMTWAVDMQNAIPQGHILARGSMGPIRGNAFIATPISGNFAFTGVNLHDVGEISGKLDSRGVFKGMLESMGVEVRAVTNDFAVSDGKPTAVEGTMQATLYGENGDMDIHSVELKVRETSIRAAGSIKGDDKATNLEITVNRGRAEDLMRPFIHDEVPIAGPISLKAHAYLGPSGDGFMERLRVKGAFTVPAQTITDQDEEKSLSAFSERAQGKQKPNTGVVAGEKSRQPQRDVLSSLNGPAQIGGGIASTSHMVFRVPGAEAMLAGTFRFHDESVHLTGKLKMDTDISHATTGFRSFLLKPLAPFFKKKNAGAVIPIAVTGLPGHYKVSQDLSHNK